MNLKSVRSSFGRSMSTPTGAATRIVLRYCISPFHIHKSLSNSTSLNSLNVQCSMFTSAMSEYSYPGVRVQTVKFSQGDKCGYG